MKSATLVGVCFVVAGAARPCKQPSAFDCIEPSIEETDWDMLWSSYQDNLERLVTICFDRCTTRDLAPEHAVLHDGERRLNAYRSSGFS